MNVNEYMIQRNFYGYTLGVVTNDHPENHFVGVKNSVLGLNHSLSGGRTPVGILGSIRYDPVLEEYLSKGLESFKI